MAIVHSVKSIRLTLSFSNIKNLSISSLFNSKEKHGIATIQRGVPNNNQFFLISTRSFGSAKSKAHAQLALKEQSDDEQYYTAPADVPEGVLLGIGNPLLDITVKADQTFLQKYGLKANNAIIAGPRHIRMYEEIMSMSPRFLPGGAAQNAIRVAQWLLQKPHATSFMGCVGNDDRANILKDAAESVGVNVSYQKEYSEQTGACAAIITGNNQERSLVSHLGAAKHFSHLYLHREDNWEMMQRADVYYVCGFMFPVCVSTIKNLGIHAAENNKRLVMNLSAVSLAHYFSDRAINIMPYIDVLVGNTHEIMQLNEGLGTGLTDIKNIASYISKMPKRNKEHNRIVIVTRGRNDTVIACNGDVNLYPVVQLDNSSIKDTNGCGDAYMGGFLSQLVQGKSLDECIKCAKYSAKTIIQHYGCTYPDRPSF